MTETGLPFRPEVTHMQEEKAGTAFRETMQGPFALGVTDPQAGAEQGDSLL